MPMAAAPVTFAVLGGATGTGEWLLLFAAILILFGPRRLPEAARTIGRLMQQWRRAANDFRDQVMLLDRPPDPPPPSPPAVTPPVADARAQPRTAPSPPLPAAETPPPDDADPSSGRSAAP